MIRTRPKEAARRVLAIVRRNNGNVAACADEAGTDRRTFQRWIAALDDEGFELRIAVEQARAEARNRAGKGAGWYRKASPRSTTDSPVD